jgi:glutamyl-tRNA synthetase
MGIEGGEAFWLAIRSNLGKVADAAQWWPVVRGPIQPVVEDRDFAQKAAGALPPAPWDATTWKTWTEAVKAATGAKGKALFMPLRLALTGVDHGPELAALLPLIGPERARARLAGQSA